MGSCCFWFIFLVFYFIFVECLIIYNLLLYFNKLTVYL